MKRRVFPLFMALVLGFSFLFSITFLSAQANHEHVDENVCVICREMQDCSDLLNTPVDRPKAVNFFRFFPSERNLSSGRRAHGFIRRAHSPVSLKVKLIS